MPGSNIFRKINKKMSCRPGLKFRSNKKKRKSPADRVKVCDEKQEYFFSSPYLFDIFGFFMQSSRNFIGSVLDFSIRLDICVLEIILSARYIPVVVFWYSPLSNCVAFG